MLPLLISDQSTDTRMAIQTIASALFARRGKMSQQQFGRLLIRGGGVQVADSLQRNGWNGREAIVSTVVTVEAASGAIRGLRYETRGKLEDIKFSAKDLFVGADPAAVITLSVDLGTLTWISTGEGARNQSAWVDSSQSKVSYKRGGADLSTELELLEAGIGKFCVRFSLLPGAVDKMFLYGGIVPHSKADLDEMVKEAGSTLLSPNCPTVALKLLSIQGKTWVGRPIELGPKELSSDKVGFGHLPLIECIASGEITWPDSNELERQLTAFLRCGAPTYNVSLSRLAELYAKEETFTALRVTNSGFSWPAYRGPLTEGQPGEEENATG